jgi:hypothetical protein
MVRHYLFLTGVLLGTWIGPMSTRADTLETRPPGAYLRVEGPVSVAGELPLAVESWPLGNYDLVVEQTGLARAKANVACDGASGLRLRPGAGALHMLIPPGVAHFGRGEIGRGLTMVGSATLGGILIWVEESDRRDAARAVQTFQGLYEQAQSEEAIRQARIAVEAASRREQDELAMRNLWIGYTAVIWAGAGVESWLLSPRPHLSARAARQYVLDVPRVGAWQTFWRSALVPGSGHRYMGQDRRANVAAVSVYGFAAGSLFAHEYYLEARRTQAIAQETYEAANTEGEIARARRFLVDSANETHDRNTLRWCIFGLTIGAYCWNVLDAAFQGSAAALPPQSAVPPRTSRLHWLLQPSPSGLSAAAIWRCS